MVLSMHDIFFCFKQRTEYEMRISDWSSDVCSSDLGGVEQCGVELQARRGDAGEIVVCRQRRQFGDHAFAAVAVDARATLQARAVEHAVCVELAGLMNLRQLQAVDETLRGRRG